MRKHLTLLTTFLVAVALHAQTAADHHYLLPDGGCHYIVETDSLTGERTMLPASSRHRSHYASTDDGLGQYGKSGMGVIGTIGEVTIPVVMVDFSDVGFLSTTTASKVEEWFNGTNYTENGNVGSVRQYFIEQSNGMFRPTFKVLGTTHTGKTVATYGAGGSNNENVEALAHTATQPYNFSPYSRTSGLTNYVPLCVIYYAGAGQHRTGNDSQIWAKFVEYGSFDYASLFGQRFKSYLFINELNGNEMDGIGTACHELSHAFGLPDVYDTSGGNCRTPGLWSLMSAGNYCMDGHSPVDLTAYERSMLGWLQLKELTSAGQYRLAPTEGAVIRNASNNKEYYIMENRTGTRWTPSSMSGGMLVYHIDYNKSAWEDKKINVDNSHPRMMVVPADNDPNDATHFDYQRDLYPYLQNDSLTTLSKPAMTAYTGSFAGKPVYNIRRDGQDITFDFIKRTSVDPIVNPDEKEVEEKTYDDRKLGTPITSLSEIKAGKPYALYNPHFKAYAIYAPKYSKKYVWTAGMKGDEEHSLANANYGRAFDVTSNFSAWHLTYNAPYVAFQNEGSELYLSTPGAGASPGCEWVASYSAMMVTELGNGRFALSTSGGSSDYFCAAPQLKDYPLSTWYSTDNGCSWQIIPIEGEMPVGPDPQGEYTLGDPITSLSEISNDEQYALYNPHFTGYAISNSEQSSTYLWTAGLIGDGGHQLANTLYSEPYDPALPAHRWSITATTGSKWLIQNVGTQTYIHTAGYENGQTGATTLVQAATPLSITANGDGTFGINRSGNEYDYMCASPQLSFPVGNWSANDDGARWQIIHLEPVMPETEGLTSPSLMPTAGQQAIYDLQGRPQMRELKKGLYIIGRRKLLR